MTMHIDPARDALLIVDVQYDFCSGGALAVPGGEAVVPAINRLAPRFAVVVATQDWHPEDHRSFAASHPGKKPFETVELAYGPQVLWPAHCVQGTRGAALHDGLDLGPAQMVVRKGFRTEIDSYSAFVENDRTTPTGLAGYLRERGVGRVFVVGLAYDFCVLYSALDARAAGFESVVVEDATRAIDLDGSKTRATGALREAGVPIVASAEITGRVAA